MLEYATVSSSSYDPASLATKLNEKAAEGWTVVSIVPTGGDVTAFLSRESGAGAAAAEPVSEWNVGEATAAAEPVVEAEPEPAVVEAVSEPAGWASAPESTSTASESTWATSTEAVSESAPSAWQPSEPTSTSDWSSGATPVVEAAQAAEPVVETPAAAETVSAPATPSVPAGWYADPAGRFELRYWDGNAWTEHVSRAGQQYTDAPVA